MLAYVIIACTKYCVFYAFAVDFNEHVK